MLNKILSIIELRKRIVYLMKGFILLGSIKQASDTEVLVTIIGSDYTNSDSGHRLHVDQRLGFTTGLRLLRKFNPDIKVTMSWLNESPREIQPMNDILPGAKPLI